MKKCLSLIVVFALILTTLAMPMTASAYEASLMAVSEDTITLSFAAKLNGEAITAEKPAHPGDEITVDVIATAESDITVNDIALAINYDTTVLDFTTVSENLTEGKVGAIDYLFYDGDKTITAADGLTIATLDFKVADSVSAASTSISFTSVECAMIYISNTYAVTEYTLATSAATVNLAQNTAAAYIDGETIVNNKTYIRAEGAALNVTIDGTNISAIALTKDGAPYGDVNAETRAIELPDAGAYKLTISVTGAADVVYDFNLMIGEVEAQLSMAVQDKNANGYYYSAEEPQTIVVPVTISGLGEEVEAAMVTFDVAYETAKLALDTVDLGANVTFADGTVKYGTESAEAGLADGATVATLKFSILEDAAVGLTDITISNPTIALVTDYIYTDETSIEIAAGTDNVTIVPAEGAAFATVTPAEINTAWVQEQEVTVVPFEGADGAVYVAIAEGGTLDSDLATVYANNAGNAITDSFIADEEKDYYVITKIGNVYQAAKLANGTDIKVDVTAPSVDASSKNMSAWVSTKTEAYVIDLSTLAPTDNKSTANFTYEWKKADDEEYAVADGNTITFEIDTTYNGTINLVVIDEAGNKSDPVNVTIKLDGNAPVVALTQESVNEAGQVVVNVAVTEAEEIATVVMYNGTVAEESIANIEALLNKENVVDNKFTVDRDKWGAGRYYVVATDAAGNQGFGYIDITFGTASQAAVKAAVVAGAATVEGAFKSVAAYNEDPNCVVDKQGEKITSNGSFTYVKFEVIPADAEGNYVNKLYIDDVADDDGVVEFSNDVAEQIKEYTIVVKQEHKVDATDVAEAEYVFSIVADDDMPSVNADTRFNIVDRSYMRAMMGDKTGETILPDNTDEFYGGIYSGDVDGDFNYTAADLQAIINSIKAGNKKGDYTFPIFNK